MGLEFSNNNLLSYFNYLRDIIYSPQRANLELDKLSDEEYRRFGEALVQFGQMIEESREFAFSLSRGELDCDLPTKGNELVAPLKSLHATLRHLTWQAKQISGGDYDQHIEFMGEFSAAFNEMVAQLAEQRREMETEAERNKESMEVLAKANSIFEAITSNMEEWIVMIDRQTGEHLFSNHSTESILTSDTLHQQLYHILFESAASIPSHAEPRKEEFTLVSDSALQHFELMLYPLTWFDHDAVACLLTDITSTKEEYYRLEDAAYKDDMTGVYNRLYGMKLLDRYANEKIPYVLVFIDMDMLKYVNDVFGHLEGDLYISSVANILQDVSPNAVVCRLGGDEFMVIFKESDIQGQDMDDVFENLRKKLAETSTVDSNGRLLYQRSISFGIMEVDEHVNLSTSDVLAAADERMYEYKKAHKQERRV